MGEKLKPALDGNRRHLTGRYCGPIEDDTYIVVKEYSNGDREDYLAHVTPAVRIKDVTGFIQGCMPLGGYVDLALTTREVLISGSLNWRKLIRLGISAGMVLLPVLRRR